MFQIVYEYADAWPQQGVLHFQVPLTQMEIAVSPDSARRKANGYLTRYVSMSLLAGKPMLIMNQRPIWRIPLELQLPELNQIATLGMIEVDAHTREVIPLSAKQIRSIQDQANELIARFTPEAAAAI
ncbi:MAG: hypothetical protein U0175_12750 [Caldilineaceae bacterium]